ncbi:beta-propeller fold lactonase family protein [Micromonospora musae]|uniref:lactonase family protein n=1 Tax=Micromonospora musae TaxID=1894970 RepID=UPI0033C4F5E2
MKKRKMLGAVVCAGSIVAGFSGPAWAGTTGQGAVFVQTDEPGGNRVIAYDGHLHQVGAYTTGGMGGVLGGAVADHLGSQGSLTLDRARHLLYAVNAGSNTVTVFRVRGARLTRLQVIGSGGEFPVSVTVHGDHVYVLNARDGGSIQGFRRFGAILVRVPSWHRGLGLDPRATPEFTHSPGQVAFTPDGRQLIVTTKANTSSIDVFGIGHDGSPSAKPVHNVENDAVPFAVDFDRTGHLVVAEAGPNAVTTYALNSRGKATKLDTEATGGTGTCWVVSTNGTFYVSNSGNATLTAVQTGRHGSLTTVGTTATAPGPIDAATSTDGRVLYVQTGGQGTVDRFHIRADGSLTAAGSVTVPGGVGGEGIAAE